MDNERLDLAWMAWTPATAYFFATIAGLLVIMTLWTAFVPQAPRRGVLGFETTPGDRLFLSLLGTAYICLLWIAFMGIDMTADLSMINLNEPGKKTDLVIWPALGIAAFWWLFCFRRV